MEESVSLLAVGEAMVDVIAPAAGAASASTHLPIHLGAGGTPVNAALAAASLGARAAVVARVGSDAAATVIREALAAAGVRAVLATGADERTGVFVDLGGAVAADRGANDLLAVGDLAEWPAHEALLVSGYTFREATLAVARFALSTSPARWRAVDLGGAPPGADTSGANVLLGTADEVRQAEPGAESKQPEALAVELAQRFELVVVKLGAGGALVAAGGTACHVRPESVERAGAVGAGDALDGGFLVGLTRSLGPRSALEVGLAAAAAHIRARRWLVTRR
jgi:ribokinase